MYVCPHKQSSGRPEFSAAELAETAAANTMSRPRATARDQLYSYPVRTRVDKATQQRLEKLLAESACQSLAEVARKILAQEKILCLYKDISMNGVMEELTSIRKELKAIGVNLNQVTRAFHAGKSEQQKAFYAIRQTELAKTVEAKTDRLLVLVAQLARKWL
jgi:hypothetical protein